MISSNEYRKYFGVATAPSNLSRLEYLAFNELKALMVGNIPDETDIVYEEFIKALMEQIYYLDMNIDLISSSSGGNYTLGSYSEGNSSKKESNNTISRISPVAYDILLNCGLLYSGLKGRC